MHVSTSLKFRRLCQRPNMLQLFNSSVHPFANMMQAKSMRILFCGNSIWRWAITMKDGGSWLSFVRKNTCISLEALLQLMVNKVDIFTYLEAVF
jgi:hypothetical protein